MINNSILLTQSLSFFLLTSRQLFLFCCVIKKFLTNNLKVLLPGTILKDSTYKHLTFATFEELEE